MAKQNRPIWAADAETDPFKRGRIPKPFVWGLYKGDDDYSEYDTIEDLLEDNAHEEAIIYAHNGGKFDWHFLIEHIPAWEPVTVIAGRLAKFKIGNLEFRDSWNIIPAPLAAYQKDKISYDIFEPEERDKPHNREAIRKYLKSDCVYLHEMISVFIADYGVQLTQAGAAIRFWSKLTKTKIPQTNALYYAELKPFYYGGRVECFHAGEIFEPFSVVDIKSAYPRAMLDNHPWGQRYSASTGREIENMSDEQIARSFIVVTARSLGAFPYRDENGLSFPADNEMRDFYVTGWEYIAARETGYLKDSKVTEMLKFHETINFKQYVDHFFALKNTADINMKECGPNSNMYGHWASQRLFAKIFLNALYGKWCANPENYEEFCVVPGHKIRQEEAEGQWNICGVLSQDNVLMSRPLPEKDHRYYDIAVGASVTGWVRAYLWRNICATNGTALYCDTDSIAAHDISQIEIGDNIGQWEHEGDFDYAAIGGKKLYAFRKVKKDGKTAQWKTATKGVKLSPLDIVKIAQGHSVTYSPEVPTFSIKTGTKFTPRRVKMLDREKEKVQKRQAKTAQEKGS